MRRPAPLPLRRLATALWTAGLAAALFAGVTGGVAYAAQPAPEGAPPLRLLSPADGAVLQSGPTLLEGYAIAGEGRSIERVEISIDGGQSWIAASLLCNEGHRWAWRFWQAEIHVAPGRYRLVVRAWDDTGQTQPEALQAVWNWKGYLNNAWRRVNIVVQEGVQL